MDNVINNLKYNNNNSNRKPVTIHSISCVLRPSDASQQTRYFEAEKAFKIGMAKLKDGNRRSALHYLKRASQHGHKKADKYFTVLKNNQRQSVVWRDIILSAEVEL